MLLFFCRWHVNDSLLVGISLVGIVMDEIIDTSTGHSTATEIRTGIRVIQALSLCQLQLLIVFIFEHSEF